MGRDVRGVFSSLHLYVWLAPLFRGRTRLPLSTSDARCHNALMDTYRVVSVGIGQWAVERTSENMSSDLLPSRYCDAAEAAFAVLEITRRELREERTDLFVGII
jgi:hypothetical protein